LPESRADTLGVVVACGARVRVWRGAAGSCAGCVAGRQGATRCSHTSDLHTCARAQTRAHAQPRPPPSPTHTHAPADLLLVAEDEFEQDGQQVAALRKAGAPPHPGRVLCLGNRVMHLQDAGLHAQWWREPRRRQARAHMSHMRVCWGVLWLVVRSLRVHPVQLPQLSELWRCRCHHHHAHGCPALHRHNTTHTSAGVMALAYPSSCMVLGS
jgi:hypothetical protein